MRLDLTTQLAAIAHPNRLDLFRLMMRRYPDRLPAGEIARLMQMRPNTVSNYLSALLRADLLEQSRVGTSLLYRARLDGVSHMLRELVGDCCRGRTDLCAPMLSPSTEAAPMSDQKFKVLFICTGNSARSIMAEALLRDIAGDRFEAHSAGTRPYSEMNPFVIDLLTSKGHDVSQMHAKNVSVYQGPDAPVFDFVFTVCNQAANEECPAWPGQTVTAHWGMDDPVKVEGTEAERAHAFQQAYGILANRISLFTSLPLESLGRASKQAELDAIGEARTAELPRA